MVILLVRVVKNDEVNRRYLLGKRTILKVMMVAFVLFQWGMILNPELEINMLIGSQISLVGIMFMVYRLFISKYGDMDIAYMDHSSVMKFQSDKYVHIADGVSVRRYDWDNNTVIEEEEGLIDIASQFGSKNYVCLFFRAEEGAILKDHKHPGKEHIFLIKGDAVVFDDPEIIVNKDYPCLVTPNTRHILRAKNFCMGAFFIEKT
jgi:quercetin dioxygenase-like cupin family protein